MPKMMCNRCGRETEFIPAFHREGDLDLMFLKCAECGTEYLSSVTDTELRRNIAAYQDMAKEILAGNATDAFIEDTRTLYRENIARGKALRDKWSSGEPT